VMDPLNNPRVDIACDVMHNMKWLRHHALELRRLLRDETLSEDYHAEFCKVIADMEEVARKARPRLPMAAE
jgi:hypothetical protein